MPAKFLTRIALMIELSFKDFLIIFDSQFLKSFVISKTSLFFEISPKLEFCNFSAILTRPCCLLASNSTTFSNWSNCCTPLTSTTPPPSLTDTLTSCRIEPIPRVTFFVLRNSLPRDNAIFFIFFESPSTGSNAISIKGTPRRSKLYSLISPLSPSSFAASSSKQID